jgi:hypothetical protein
MIGPLTVVVMDGRAYLEKLIADGFAVPHRITLDRSEVRGVALGLLAAGTIARSDLERILADLDETLKQAGLLRVMRAEKLLGGSGSGRAGVVRPEWMRAIDEPPAPVLRRVLPLVGRTFQVGHVVENLISLEVWSTLLRLNLAHGGEDHRMTECFSQTLKWKGWDDAGTQYRDAGGSGTLVQSLHARNRSFTPGPSDHARLLTLVVEHANGPATLQIPLSDLAVDGQEN